MKKPDGSFASSDVEKAKLFKKHLHEIFQAYPKISSTAITNTVQLYLDSPLPMSLPVKHIHAQWRKFYNTKILT